MMMNEQTYSSPVYNVKRIPIEKIQANTYNPNHVAPPEMELLYQSIKEDGYTMPIVCYYLEDDDMYEIVDGYHRYTTMLLHEDIKEREGGCLPVTVIDKPLTNRIASTIRHNRARGVHSIDLMTNIVAELTKSGMGDEWILRNLGMDMEELTRLKQLSGLQELFRNADFSQSWTVNFEFPEEDPDDSTELCSHCKNCTILTEKDGFTAYKCNLEGCTEAKGQKSNFGEKTYCKFVEGEPEEKYIGAD